MNDNLGTLAGLGLWSPPAHSRRRGGLDRALVAGLTDGVALGLDPLGILPGLTLGSLGEP